MPVVRRADQEKRMFIIPIIEKTKSHSISFKESYSVGLFMRAHGLLIILRCHLSEQLSGARTLPREPRENPEGKGPGPWFSLTPHFVRPSNYCSHPIPKIGQFPGITSLFPACCHCHCHCITNLPRAQLLKTKITCLPAGWQRRCPGTGWAQLRLWLLDFCLWTQACFRKVQQLWSGRSRHEGDKNTNPTPPAHFKRLFIFDLLTSIGQC